MMKFDLTVIHACSAASFGEDMPFPEVVKQLGAAGVERYYADLVQLQKIYYGGAGESHAEPFPDFPPAPVVEKFSAEDVQQTIAAIQQRRIGYREFLRRIMAAGAASYSVFIEGRKAIYTGRDGDFHVELFPGSK